MKLEKGDRVYVLLTSGDVKLGTVKEPFTANSNCSTVILDEKWAGRKEVQIYGKGQIKLMEYTQGEEKIASLPVTYITEGLKAEKVVPVKMIGNKVNVELTGFKLEFEMGRFLDIRDILQSEKKALVENVPVEEVEKYLPCKKCGTDRIVAEQKIEERDGKKYLVGKCQLCSSPLEQKIAEDK